MYDKGQDDVYNFDTPDAEFEFEVENHGSISLMTFTRKRLDQSDDTLRVWVRIEWLGKIAEQITPYI